MKRSPYLFILPLVAGLLAAAFNAFAGDSVREQVLVFRNTGEINLFYSDELKSIEIVEDSVSEDYPEGVRFQKFIFADKTVAIPVAEIDSVTFGNRNNIEPKPGVRRLTDTEASYIESFDGTTLIYKESAPQSTIPAAGQKVYYDNFTEIFPYGLCGRVMAQSREGDRVTLSFEELDATELFDSYLFSAEEAELLSPSRADGALTFDPKTEWDFEIDGVKTYGRVGVPLSLQFNDVVTDLRNHYYHARISLHLTPELLAAFMSDDSSHKDNPVEYESDTYFSKSIPLQGRTIEVSLDVKSFIEVAAELGFEYHFENDLFVEFEWTRKNGENFFSDPVFSQPLGDRKATYEVHLDGSLVFGPQVNLRIGVLFDAVGAGVKFRFGPKFSASFSLGIIQQLAERYDEETYAKSHLDFCWWSGMKTFWYTQNLFTHEISEHDLPFETEFETEHKVLNLFPEFHSRASTGRATAASPGTTADDAAVTVATYTETELEAPLQLGFDLIDSQTEATLMHSLEEEGNVIEADTVMTQVYADELVLTGSLKNADTDKIRVQPVFKYFDNIVKAEPVGISDDVNMMPVISTGAAGSAYFISGASFVNQKSTETTTLIEGNFLPVGSRNDKIKDGLLKWRTETIMVEKGELVGSWHGMIKGIDFIIKFNADDTGSFNGRSFDYAVDPYSKGLITLTFADESQLRIVIKSLSDHFIKLSLGSSTTLYTFYKL